MSRFWFQSAVLLELVSQLEPEKSHNPYKPTFVHTSKRQNDGWSFIFYVIVRHRAATSGSEQQATSELRFFSILCSLGLMQKKCQIQMISKNDYLTCLYGTCGPILIQFPFQIFCSYLQLFPIYYLVHQKTGFTLSCHILIFQGSYYKANHGTYKWNKSTF